MSFAFKKLICKHHTCISILSQVVLVSNCFLNAEEKREHNDKTILFQRQLLTQMTYWNFDTSKLWRSSHIGSRIIHFLNLQNFPLIWSFYEKNVMQKSPYNWKMICLRSLLVKNLKGDFQLALMINDSLLSNDLIWRCWFKLLLADVSHQQITLKLW